MWNGVEILEKLYTVQWFVQQFQNIFWLRLGASLPQLDDLDHHWTEGTYEADITWSTHLPLRRRNYEITSWKFLRGKVSLFSSHLLHTVGKETDVGLTVFRLQQDPGRLKGRIGSIITLG